MTVTWSAKVWYGFMIIELVIKALFGAGPTTPAAGVGMSEQGSGSTWTDQAADWIGVAASPHTGTQEMTIPS